MKELGLMLNGESQCIEREEEEEQEKQVIWRGSILGKQMNSLWTFQPALDSTEGRQGSDPDNIIWSRRGGHLSSVWTTVHEEQVIAILCHYA